MIKTDMKSELCKSCIHTNVCGKYKNIIGDVVFFGNPIFCDNDKLWEEYKEREKKGFPCEDYLCVEDMEDGEDEMTSEWIPVMWHEITDEEREREGYPKDWVVHIDCEMPCDEQEILVQTKSGYIRWDVCYEDGEFSLDSGWDWTGDIVAWMPLPKPYKGGDSE